MKARFLALAALVLGLASCQTEPEGLNVNVGGEVDTTICVSLPEAETRAAGQDSALGAIGNIDLAQYDIRYILEVYDAAGNLAKERQVNYEDSSTTTAFSLRLVPGRDYSFVVWADFVLQGTTADYHYDTANGLKNVTLKTTWDAIDESRDAYTGVKLIEKFSSASTIDLVITRPFAKLRVVTNDIKELYGELPVSVTVEYSNKFYTTFNALSEEATNLQYYTNEIVADLTEDTYNGETSANNGVMTLFADYFFGAEDDRVMFTMDVVGSKGAIPTITFNTNIPVQRNYLTTIYGPILTDYNNVTVTIDESFENGTNWNPGNDEYDVEIWDGKTVKEPAYDEATKTYIVKCGSELAWIADVVNGTTRATDAFIGKTIKLANDINLGGNEWTPIGSVVKFQGSFDGQGHTIKGLAVTERHDTDRAALFGSIAGVSEFKNVVIDDACIKYPEDGDDYYAAAIVGTVYGTHTFENITVKNSTITGNNKVGAIFAHDGLSTQITIDNCHVDGCYIASEDLNDGGCVGGLIGYYATGSADKPNTISNSSVKNSTIVGINSSNSGKRANSQFIGSIETKDDMILNIVDCVVENNNFSQTIDGTQPVTYVGVFNADFIGGDRNEANKGKVVINGYETVATGVGVNEENDYLVTSTEGLTYIAEQVNTGNDEVADSEIILDGDIDLSQLVITRAGIANNWTPIGTAENPFTGTFNGNGKTIKNLALVESEAKEGKAYVGFFGYAKDATIKNVTFENVYINIPCLDIDHSQGHIGAVAGSLEGTSTIEDVTVKGDIQVEATLENNGASRVAVVAGGNAYGNVTMKNVHVIANAGSYLKANNNVGALAGQLQGKSVFENCSSNIDVTGYKFFAGGIIGLAAGDQLFTNCHTTGDVTILAGRAGRNHDQYRVGGIAGGWADGAKNVCTLTNCSYTGNVSGRNSDGSVANPLDYMGYVGRGYTLNGCQGSKVVIDGMEFVQKYDTATEAGIYDISNLEISDEAEMFWFAQMVNSNKCTFAGQTVKLAADIDLNYEEWTPIGSAYKDHGFMGNFDGNGKTIKNLKISALTPDSDGYVYAGLFGVTEGVDANNENYIKNLTIENVNISTEGHIVAAAIAYPYYTEVENVTVKGNVSIKGGDYTAGVLAYTRRCVNAKNIAVESNGSIEGNNTVGGVISDIQMNGGLTADYSNFKASGLTVKGNKSVGGIAGIICLQTLNGATVENVTIVCDDVRKGQIIGSLGDDSVINSVSVSNVYGADNLVGATYSPGKNCIVTIDGVVYEYLENGQLMIDGKFVVANGVVVDSEGTYYISNKDGMFWFANEVNTNKNAFSGKSVKLAANINLNNEPWAPIGQTGATTFNGVFDGQNHTISNLNVNSIAQTGAHYSSGLFGWVETHTEGNGILKNVNIDGVVVKGNHNCGALVGYITEKYARVENCHVANAAIECHYANGDADGDKAGALIGNATNATKVDRCSATNSTVSAGRDAGQLIGAGKVDNVTNCSATNVAVSANGEGTGKNIRNEIVGRAL